MLRRAWWSRTPGDGPRRGDTATARGLGQGWGALTADELGRLPAVAKDVRLVLVELCGRNALRPAEPRAPRLADIDLDAQELRPGLVRQKR